MKLRQAREPGRAGRGTLPLGPRAHGAHPEALTPSSHSVLLFVRASGKCRGSGERYKVRDKDTSKGLSLELSPNKEGLCARCPAPSQLPGLSFLRACLRPHLTLSQGETSSCHPQVQSLSLSCSELPTDDPVTLDFSLSPSQVPRFPTYTALHQQPLIWNADGPYVCSTKANQSPPLCSGLS